MTRPALATAARREMHDKFWRRFERPSPQDIRHIIPVETLKTRIENRLNKMSRPEQIEALSSKGIGLRKNASDRAINSAAQRLLSMAANDRRNLFVDSASENRALGAQNDLREFRNRRMDVQKALASHQNYMRRKYFP